MKRDAPLRITVLVENTAIGDGLGAEHGLSFWIEWGDRRVLFDTGQTDLLSRNAGRLGIDLSRADAIALSHGHADHTGGLATALHAARNATVYLHPDALHAKFSRRANGTLHDISIPPACAAALGDRASRTVLAQRTTPIGPGIYLTGVIPRTNDYEDTGGDFFLDRACMHPDPLFDDQALYLHTGEGTIVLLGCAHAGVVNTLKHIRALTDDAPVRAVIGGMHLLRASELRMSMTLAALRGYPDLLLAPAHCTGADATGILWGQFPGRCRECRAGSKFVFGAGKPHRQEFAC